jgi:hypothetical protein
LKEEDNNSFEELPEDAENVDDSVHNDILDLLSRVCINIISDDDVMKGVQRLFNKNKSFFFR